MLHSYIDMSQFYRDVTFLNVEITHCQIVMQYELHTESYIKMKHSYIKIKHSYIKM